MFQHSSVVVVSTFYKVTERWIEYISRCVQVQDALVGVGSRDGTVALVSGKYHSGHH